MGWAAKAEIRANGLYQAHIVGDAGDPLFIAINIVKAIDGIDWRDFAWKSEIRKLPEAVDPLASFTIDDNGTIETELHIMLTLADTTPLRTGCENHFDVRSTGESPVVPFTCARGVIVPSVTVTRP